MRARSYVLPALLTVALAAGCSTGGDDSTADTASANLAPAEAPQVGAGGGDTGDSAGDSALSVTNLRVAPGRDVIRTAELSVRVDDVPAAAESAARLAAAAGGGVEAEDRSGSGDDASAFVQLRVPPEEFDRTIGALADLGEEQGRRLGSEDVTDQVVDLEARLATQRASVDRVRALLSRADALGEVVQIEGELTKRTADLEALQARRESLTARVDLSTITVRFERSDAVVPGAALGFGDGLSSGWAALTAVGRLLAVSAGALLPFLPLLLVGGYLALRARRRRTAVATT